MNIQKLLFILCGVLFLSACQMDNTAYINDVAVKVAVDTGFKVDRVNGDPPRRVKHGVLITRVPYVIVTPGVNEVTVRDDHESLTISYTFEAGKVYRIERDGDSSYTFVVQDLD